MTHNPSATKRFLNTAEVCVELGISRRTLTQWCSDGRGPRRTRLPNGEYRYRTDHLEDWMLTLEDGTAA